jgi:hypothetical protein
MATAKQLRRISTRVKHNTIQNSKIAKELICREREREREKCNVNVIKGLLTMLTLGQEPLICA